MANNELGRLTKSMAKPLQQHHLNPQQANADSSQVSPKELLLSLIINTTPTLLEVSASKPAPQDFGTHMEYTVKQ